MEKSITDGQRYDGNERYEGYCKDLADLISNHLNIKVVLKLVNDSKYGGIDSTSPSSWNGMVGELTRQVRLNLSCNLKSIVECVEKPYKLRTETKEIIMRHLHVYSFRFVLSPTLRLL